MPIFQDELKDIASDSPFTSLELQALYDSDAERQKFMAVHGILKNATDSNDATQKVMAMGKDAVKVLVKLGAFALLP